MLDAAMQRRYSGSSQAFFTGGGVHAYANFEKWENYQQVQRERRICALGEQCLRARAA